MGVDSADFDQDGFMELFVTNLNHEFYAFYRNKHDETFDVISGPTGIAIIVVIEKLQSPAAHQLAGGGNSGWTSDVVECLVMFVAVERVELMIEIGDEQVQKAVLVEIRGVDSHARPGLATFPKCYTRRESDLLKPLPFLILEQEVRLGVVGDKQVHPAVVIYI